MAVYYPGATNLLDLKTERMNHFMRFADYNFHLLPMSRQGLIEHVKRACFQGGWLWREALSNVTIQNPENWGWIKKDGTYFPKWQTETDPESHVLKVCQVCTCQKAICKQCRCAKTNMACLPFCSCQQKCVKKE